MTDDLGRSSGFGGSNQRKLMIIRIENILKTSLPKDMDDMTAEIMYQSGLTEDKVREYVRLFFRLGKIAKDKENERVLIWKNKAM